MDQELRNKLEGEIDQLGWRELTRSFAEGRLVYVSSELSLLDAALALAEDKKQQVESWLNTASLRVATEEDAKIWEAEKPTFDVLIIDPFVLIKQT